MPFLSHQKSKMNPSLHFWPVTSNLGEENIRKAQRVSARNHNTIYYNHNLLHLLQAALHWSEFQWQPIKWQRPHHGRSATFVVGYHGSQHGSLDSYWQCPVLPSYTKTLRLTTLIEILMRTVISKWKYPQKESSDESNRCTPTIYPLKKELHLLIEKWDLQDEYLRKWTL